MFKIRKISSLFYFIGFLIVFAETILYFYGKSICTTQECKVVESFVKGGNLSLLISGLIVFGILFFISSYKFSEPLNNLLEKLHSGILVVALSVEGYLLGFQSFIIKEICLFCLAVFGILFLSSLLRIFEKRFEIILAFAGFISVFFMTYVVNPEIKQVYSGQYVLVYSKGCPHCEEVIQFCKTHSILVQTIEAKNIAGILKSLKIENVPVLFCDEGETKKIIIGKDNIKEYLFTKALPTNTEEGLCPIFEKKKCQ